MQAATSSLRLQFGFGPAITWATSPSFSLIFALQAIRLFLSGAKVPHCRGRIFERMELIEDEGRIPSGGDILVGISDTCRPVGRYRQLLGREQAVLSADCSKRAVTCSSTRPEVPTPTQSNGLSPNSSTFVEKIDYELRTNSGRGRCLAGQFFVQRMRKSPPESRIRSDSTWTKTAPATAKENIPKEAPDHSFNSLHRIRF